MDAYLRVIYNYKGKNLGKARAYGPLEARKIIDCFAHLLKFLHSFSISRTAACRDYKFGDQEAGLLNGRDASLPVPV